MQVSEYKKQFKQIKSQVPEDWQLHSVRRLKDTTDHPINYKDIECAFVSTFLNLPPKSTILNVGSYNQYIIGLLSNYAVTTLDVRSRVPFMNTEKVVTSDIKDIKLAKESFDAVISLSSIEHFGLGRYGDKIDLDVDVKAFVQFKRLLKPQGLLFFTTTIKRGEPELCFNAHKTYTLDIIHNFCSELEKVEEMFISKEKLNFCAYNELTDKSKTWDIYCGCWRKV